MKNLYYFLIATLLLTACKQQTPTTKSESVKKDTPHATPDWFKNANIYEVNLRQYTPEGTFKAFEAHLPRLKEMGADILWFMPITSISKKNRKGSLGSYYAVADYKDTNPEHGTIDDFRHMVKAIHDAGMYVMLDFVPNHSGWDNPLLIKHPEWYTQIDGKIVDPIDPETGKPWGWTDVADFNFDNKELWNYHRDVLKFWIEECDVDGFRCDVAHGVPIEFWGEIIPEVRKLKPIVMLAESEGPEYHKNGFDITYAWQFHHIMNDMAKGKKPISSIDDYLKKDRAEYPPNATRLYFTSNHDENSWSGSEYERMGDAHKALAVLSATLPGALLVYTGQEDALERRLKFFEKDLIEWGDFSMEDFYKKLFALKHNNTALQNATNNSDPIRLKTDKNDAIYAFRRIADANNEILVVLNLSDKKQSVKFLNIEAVDYTNIFTGEKTSIGEEGDNQTIEMDAWGYLVLEK